MHAECSSRQTPDQGHKDTRQSHSWLSCSGQQPGADHRRVPRHTERINHRLFRLHAGVVRWIVIYSKTEGTCMAHLFDRITVNPQQCGGRPCVRGMRIRVSDVLELLAEGMTPEQILDEHPDLELEDIHACLRFASRRVSHPIVAA